MVEGALNHVLEALLYRRTEREAFLAGDLARFDLSAEDVDALSAIDREQLVSAAKLAREHVVFRSHRGVGSLVQAFGETLRAWQREHPSRTLDDLAEDFVGSRHFDAYRTHAFAGRGRSLEETFFRFAEDASVGAPAVRLRECALAILRGLASTPAPVFLLPDFVRRCPKGFYIVDADGPTLLAILGGKFVEGRITPYIAALLTSAEVPPAALPATEAERTAVAEELARLGLRRAWSRVVGATTRPDDVGIHDQDPL